MVELLVAMTLFMVVIALASGIFIRSLRTQRATVALIAANSNASLAIEQIMREMRTGKDFDIIGGKGSEITFFSAREGGPVTYRWNQTDKSIERSDPETTTLQAITAENVTVEKLEFTLLDDPSYPPRITIVVQIGAPGAPGEGSFINLQTTVSSRAPVSP